MSIFALCAANFLRVKNLHTHSHTHTYKGRKKVQKKEKETEHNKTKEACHTISVPSCECNELARLCMNFIFILIINTNLMKFNNILVYCGFLWFRRPKPAFLLWNSVQFNACVCVCVETKRRKSTFILNMVCNLANRNNIITLPLRVNTHTFLSPKMSKSVPPSSNPPSQYEWRGCCHKWNHSAPTKNSFCFFPLSVPLSHKSLLRHCCRRRHHHHHHQRGRRRRHDDLANIYEHFKWEKFVA